MSAADAQLLPIFEHIPKTAGSTMRAILRRVYGRQRVFVITDDYRARIGELSRRLRRADGEVRAVSSHAGYGFHESLPACNGRRYAHYTILRESVERVLSHYFHAVQRQMVPPSTSLETFLHDDVRRGHNLQTAFLAGLELRNHVDGLTLAKDLYDDELLAAAKASLDRMTAVGLTERFDESLMLFRSIFGWQARHLLYDRRNVGLSRPRGFRPSPEDRALVRRNNELDLELYAHAQERFRDQSRDLGRGRVARVWLLRRINAAWQNSRLHPRHSGLR
ncbi:MAG: hypothetical protein JRG76_16610 [Deltaproteobacteria bacterium]|nr:hypothetical protein [Deltaproteobacteria bacterium]